MRDWDREPTWEVLGPKLAAICGEVLYILREELPPEEQHRFDDIFQSTDKVLRSAAKIKDTDENKDYSDGLCPFYPRRKAQEG